MEGTRLKPNVPGRVLAWIGTYKYVLLAVLLGVLLLLLPEKEKNAEEAGNILRTDSFDRTAVQEEMEKILSAIDGTGQLKLMLTVRGGGEYVLAQDRSLTQKQSEGQREEYTSKEETVVLGSGSNADVVVTGSSFPDYVGALVVCEGGGSATVRLQVTQAVSALTGLSSDRISVIQGNP